MADMHIQVDIPAVSIFEMPLDAPTPSTVRTRQDHIEDLRTLIGVIKGIYLRDRRQAEWPWYGFYNEVLRFLSLSSPRIRGNQRRLLYIVPQGRLRRILYRHLVSNTEQWSLVATSSLDTSYITGNLPATPTINTSVGAVDTSAPIIDTSHIIGNPTAAPHNPSADAHSGASNDNGVMEVFQFDAFDDAFDDDFDDALVRGSNVAQSSPLQGPSVLPHQQHLSLDEDISLPPLPSGNIFSSALSTNMIEPSHSSWLSELSVESGFADDSAELSANTSSEPLTSQQNHSVDNSETSVIIQNSVPTLSEPVNLEHVQRTAQNRARNPRQMIVYYEERIPDFFVSSQLKAQRAYSTVGDIPSSTGHPILILEIKPLDPAGSWDSAEEALDGKLIAKQTSAQACLCLDEYKLDVITVMSAAGLYVRFDEYRREDVAPFLGRPIPDNNAATYAQPSWSSDIMYLFNHNMSDYSQGVIEHWNLILQLA